MIKMRCGVFETNSSSTHSVSIKNGSNSLDYSQLKFFIKDDGYIHIKFQEFGWGFDKYWDAYMKLVYIVQLLGHINNIDIWWEEKTDDEFRNEFKRLSEWDWINSTISSTCSCNGIYIDNFNGYIDHQSYEDYSSVYEFLCNWGVQLKEFIFDKDISLIISNDNC